VGDLDNDGILDIVVPMQDGLIRAYNSSKKLLWKFDYAQGSFIYASEPVIGDIDGDSRLEVVFGTYDPEHGTANPVGLWILEHDGRVKPGSPLAVGSSGIMAAPTLANFDQDDFLEIVAVTNVGQVYVWDTPAPFNRARLPWPMGRLNLQRTASLLTGIATLKGSRLEAVPEVAIPGGKVRFTLYLKHEGLTLKGPVEVTFAIPAGLKYISGTATAPFGNLDDSQPSKLRWTGHLSKNPAVEISYQTKVVQETPGLLIQKAQISAGEAGKITKAVEVTIRERKFLYIPLILRKSRGP
jgi:hypothetical protein